MFLGYGPPSYLDLGHLAQVLADGGSSGEVIETSRRLNAILEEAVIAEKHGPARPGSTGVTIYFPNSTLYGAYGFLPGSNVYAAFTEQFVNQSLWDDFLLFHYTDAPMPALGAGEIAYAAENAAIIGPGVSKIEIAPITSSSDVISGSSSAFLETDVTGGNVAFVNIFWGLSLADTNQLLILESFPYRAELDHQVNGVIFPNWPAQTENGALHLAGEVDVESLVVTDGTTQAFATFREENYYGRTVFVQGIHTSSASGEQHYSKLRFNVDSAEMLNMILFTQAGNDLIPHEYDPQPGDTFAFLFEILNPATGEWSVQMGDTFTFGEENFWLDTKASPPGQYFLGVSIVDLDGILYEQTVFLTVEE